MTTATTNVQGQGVKLSTLQASHSHSVTTTARWKDGVRLIA